MKSYSRRAAAIVLAATISVSSAAVAAPQQRADRGEKIDRIVRVIKKKVQKLFGVTSNDDGLTPPVPPPAPPPNP